jgi:hypothetical protein
MELEDEVESLKAQIKREEKAREQQEWLVDIEINDLSKRQPATSPSPALLRFRSLADFAFVLFSPPPPFNLCNS